MTPDPYVGTDLLAEVFPGTADAPLPLGSAASRLFYPHPSDTRWKPRPRRALCRAEVAEYVAEALRSGRSER